MKILHTITTLNAGGAENHLLDLVNCQVADGLEVYCVYLKVDLYSKKNLVNQFKNLGAKVYCLDIRYYGQIKPLLKLRKIIKQFNPDIVHAHLAPAELYSRFALIGLKQIFVISRHNLKPFVSGFFSKYLEKIITKRAQYIIAISQLAREYLIKRNNELKNISAVIHYGIDIEKISCISSAKIEKFKDKLNITEDTLLLGTVSRLVYGKSIDCIIEGYAKFTKSNPKHKTKLIIVGDGELKSQLQLSVVKLNISTDVIFTGFKKNIPLIINALDIFLFASKTEGFGLVLLEAMAAKKPIITTNVGIASGTILDGKNGFIIEKANAENLAKNITKLVDSPNLRQQFGLNSYNIALKKFTLDKVHQQTLKIYQNLISQKSLSK